LSPLGAQDRNAYRRFLRSALAYPILAFWPNQRVIIQAILHDNRTVAADEYFGWHTPWKMRALSGVEVATDEVQLLDSDHRVSGRRMESNFIQLIDVILGATRVSLDDTTTRPLPKVGTRVVALDQRAHPS
jgi:hypothetical protein